MNNLNYKCAICGNNKGKHKVDFSKRLNIDMTKFQVVKCLRCGFHSLEPGPTNDELKIIYKNYSEQGNRLEVEKWRLINIYPHKIDLIRRFSPGAKKILDIGAGIGGFKSLAEENGYDVIGIEPEESQVNIAKINFNVDLVCTTFESFSQSNNTKFDVIHLHHVLEHLRNPKKILLEIKNMLNDTGILIVEVPNQFFVLSKEIYVKLGKIKLKKPYNPYHHVNFFSPSTLKKLFEDCSYKIIELNQPKKYSKKLLHRVYLLLANIIKMGISTRIEIIANKI